MTPEQIVEANGRHRGEALALSPQTEARRRL